MKLCSNCKETKEDSKYYPRKYPTGAVGLSAKCRDCHKKLYFKRYEQKRNVYNKTEAYRESRRKYRRTTAGITQNIIDSIKGTTKDTDITKDWLKTKIFNGKCELTGIPFSNQDFGTNRRPFKASVDRIDSNKGYYKDNCRVILSWLNIAKSDLPNSLFESSLIEAAECIKIRQNG